MGNERPPTIILEHLAGDPIANPGIQVAISVEIAQRSGMSIHWPAQPLVAVAESPRAIVQPDRVWLECFVTTIGEKCIKVAVPIDVSQSHVSGRSLNYVSNGPYY
ncbi:MAG TPA: hypothetical protein VMY40_06775 [Anaerolineae bacterium]|nr:hypothetical protein [Anaerolineae bacterium]